MMLIIFEHHGAPVPIHTNCSHPASQRANKRRIQLRARLRSSEQALQDMALRRRVHRRCTKKPLALSEEPPITSLSVGNDRQPTRQERGAQLAKAYF